MTVTDGFSCGPIECTDSFAEQTVQLRGGATKNFGRG